MIPGSIMHEPNTVLVNKLMELAQDRQQLVAHNIANANTPGYLRQDLEFEKALARQIRSGNLDRISDMRVEVVKDSSNAPKLDGNNIKLGQELNAMMQTGIYYNLLTRVLQTKIGILRSAIGSR